MATNNHHVLQVFFCITICYACLSASICELAHSQQVKKLEEQDIVQSHSASLDLPIVFI